jgi:hypothetical protein
VWSSKPCFSLSFINAGCLFNRYVLTLFIIIGVDYVNSLFQNTVLLSDSVIVRFCGLVYFFNENTKFLSYGSEKKLYGLIKSQDSGGNRILFNKRIMLAITREDDFVSRAAGECCNSSERVIAIIREENTILLLRLGIEIDK